MVHDITWKRNEACAEMSRDEWFLEKALLWEQITTILTPLTLSTNMDAHLLQP